MPAPTALVELKGWDSQMTEASDQLRLVHHVCCDLHAPHLVHELIQTQQLIHTGLHHIGGCLYPVGLRWEHLQVMIGLIKA